MGSRQNEQNKAKHRISFETAQTVFKDEDAITFDDPYRHETRFRTIGTVGRLLLIVVHTEDDPEPTTGEKERANHQRQKNSNRRKRFV